MRIPHALPAAVAALALAASVVPLAAAPSGAALERRLREAEALVDRALVHARAGTIEERRLAVRDLEQATQLAPGRPDYELMLARVYLAAGYVRKSRQMFARVVALAPNDAEARFGLGRMWRRDYLKYLDTTSLVRAADQLGWATRLDSSNTAAWVMLSSLQVERGDLPAALVAAECACRHSPRSPEALAALGSARWRLGDVEGADSAFRVALPRMPDKVRRRFDDIAPLASEADTAKLNHLPLEEQYEFTRRFWAEHDPDLATAENESRLEYWARVAQAWSLWYNTKRDEWDERGEIYVRFGPPGSQTYNPVGMMLAAPVAQTSQFMFPMNVLQWNYPALGMSVNLQDRVLSEYYLMQRYPDREPDPHPDPDSLAKHDLVGTHGLRGVFPSLPPGARRLPMVGQVAQFEGERRPRLVATLEVPATPGDSLQADYVVMDSTERVVARGSRTLSPSACAADSYRVADFASDLPPGDYRVGLSVSGARGRGALRVPVTLFTPDTALTLSDLVVTCGTPGAFEAAVRLAANPAGRVRGNDPLTAYFEIYHLATAADGQARFEVEWVVRSDERDRRIWLQRALAPRPSIPSLEARRAETNAGPLRRQFVSVPVQSLPPGRYRLEVTVHDLLSGTVAAGQAKFERGTAR
jgi:GWxTD domain-containing protein